MVDFFARGVGAPTRPSASVSEDGDVLSVSDGFVVDAEVEVDGGGFGVGVGVDVEVVVKSEADVARGRSDDVDGARGGSVGGRACCPRFDVRGVVVVVGGVGVGAGAGAGMGVGVGVAGSGGVGAGAGVGVSFSFTVSCVVVVGVAVAVGVAAAAAAPGVAAAAGVAGAAAAAAAAAPAPAPAAAATAAACVGEGVGEAPASSLGGVARWYFSRSSATDGILPSGGGVRSGLGRGNRSWARRELAWRESERGSTWAPSGCDSKLRAAYLASS